MNENQNNVQYYEDEIDLRELIMALWKRKKMIISFTLIVAILAGMFSMFVLSPVYNTKLDVVISMPESYHTRYGEYKLPITTNEQYINLFISNDVLLNTIKDMGYEEVSMESLKKRISIGNMETKAGLVQNSFEISVSADNPEESLELAQTLFDNYLEFMDVMTKERAISYYYNHFIVELNTLEDSLDIAKETLIRNEELLAQTPKLINQGEASLEIQTKLTNESDYVIPVNTVNPNYIKIENDIVGNKQAINGIENSMRMYNQYLDELNKEQEIITEYYESGRAGKLESSTISVVKTSIYLPSPPIAPSQKTSPSNSMNIVIGAVLGGMIGVMVALVKEYWFKN
ncbi:Wzz/FepE/Etk N-terminal domain-containing protein [Sedimentibacter sp. MB31-C6]|uniref:Wzz/FepE/Etk N-terminal domain-containing protein n=1 Tax=Sedimentibacter sp. MB31-C6 TaxID=3109366 RepID=UPI002DDCC37F|nr:Wzz/FepE/Etk N-terminal domain-containing protein [Sedimentibacter sp. MB36-C1]WSI03727.1 Wzz/FepE/Etk N-terminal domain-containing protein [Sedimentibacter sp. MB36-C1]